MGDRRRGRPFPAPSPWALGGVGVLVALGVVVALPSWREVAGTDGLPDARVVAVVVLANTIANALLAENSYALTRLAASDAADRGTAWRVFALSQPARYLAPGGHIAARAALGRRHGLPLPQGVGLGIADLAMTVATLSVVSLATAPTWLDLPAATAARWVAVGPALVCAAILLAPAATIRKLGIVLGRMPRSLVPARLRTRLPGAVTGLPAGAGPLVRATVVRYLVNLFVRGAAFALLATAIAGHAGPAAVATALGAFAVGNLVGRLAIIAPAGLGARDATIVAILAPSTGLVSAAAVALAARALDALGEFVLLAMILAVVRPSAPGRLRGGEVLRLDDGRPVTVGAVTERTWSRVAEGVIAGQPVFVKQHLDRRRRPDDAGSRAQSMAVQRCGDLGLRVPALVGHVVGRGLSVRVLVADLTPGTHRAGRGRNHSRLAPGAAAHAAAVVGALTAAAGPVPRVGIDSIGLSPAGPVLFDVPAVGGAADGAAAAMVTSVLWLGWGRPLSAFLRGPSWPDVRTVARAVTGPRARPLDARVVEAVWREGWHDRRREWVGVSRLSAGQRWVGVHTIGWCYHRRVVAGLRAGALRTAVDAQGVRDPVVGAGA